MQAGMTPHSLPLKDIENPGYGNTFGHFKDSIQRIKGHECQKALGGIDRLLLSNSGALFWCNISEAGHPSSARILYSCLMPFPGHPMQSAVTGGF